MINLHKAWLWQNPAELSVSMGLYTPTWRRHGDGLEDIVLAHPRIFPGYVKGQYKGGMDAPTIWQYENGHHFDHWGCEWDNIIAGHDSICIGHPVKTLEDAVNIEVPKQDIGLEHGIIFLRYTFLRGYEEAMIDFYEENEIFRTLMPKVLEYAIRQTQITLDSMGSELFISYADDLGMQNMLPTGPDRWRRVIGPCYEKLFGMCKDRNKMIFMHTDGCIFEIIPDLRKYGLDVVNAQYRANGLDNLYNSTRGSRYKKIALHLDLDRQLFPVASPEEIEAHIYECIERLITPEGGLSLYAEIAEDIPLQNIAKIADILDKIMDYYNHK